MNKIKQKHLEAKKIITDRINSTPHNKQQRSFDIRISSREQTTKTLNDYHKRKLININIFDWSKLELYEGTVAMLNKMLSLGQIKLAQNDLVDIFQLYMFNQEVYSGLKTKS